MATPTAENVTNSCGDVTSEFDVKSFLETVEPSMRREVEEYIQTIKVETDEKAEIEKAESWIEWAKRLPYLRLVNTDVPDFILPKHCSGELIDAKVFTKRGPDDSIYDAHPKVRERVARGNCFLRITHGPHKGTKCILYALKKFTGGLGDDDDRDKGDNHTWKRYFTKSLDEAKTIVATRKANGEAAHLSCIQIDGQYLLCAGSKNVHMLIRNKGDISFYRGDRYRIATEICHTIMDYFDEMDPVQKQSLFAFLAETRLTAVFEILSPAHQHVEDLSYLDKPVLQFITWTRTELEPDKNNQLCTVPPHIGIEIARGFGLKTVDYEIILFTDVESRMTQIRQGYQYEGEVLYFLDDSNCVIGLLKKKTVWYIICRAIREKARNAAASLMKNKGTFSMTKTVMQIEKRTGEIQKWLGLSDEATSKWKNLGIAFVKWCLDEIEHGRLHIQDIADRYPVIWKQHLEISDLSDEIPVQCLEEEEPEGASAS